ncbi:MAG TPA: squalene/phytoene synthase family protein, partial [Alphaproteobacteria bacterium]|nr:squalene/phytoene synthase family protein [Alphaproteobacteria bacterium]
NIYADGKVPEHEVLQPLAQAITGRRLTQEHFDKLIYAREFDLEDVMPTTVEGLINYADFTSTPLMNLALEVMGENPAQYAVQPVAVNYALAGILRAVPFFAAQRRCLLPENLMVKYGVKKLYELKPQGDLPAVIRDVAEQFVPGLKPAQPFLKLSDTLAGMEMRRLKACGFNPFRPTLRKPLPFKALRLFLSNCF